MKNELVVAKNLTKHYPLKASSFAFSIDKVHALNNISFNIGYNETLGLVGESGCGKTTTGRLLLRVIEPTTGSLYINKKWDDIQNLEKIEQDILKEKNKKRKKEIIKLYRSLKKRTDFFSYSYNLLKTERLNLQYIFQDPYMSLNPLMQVRDIVTESLIENKKTSLRDRDKVARRYLNIVGLPKESIYKYPHEFSGGQRQRLNIARAIASQPKFIVCDEPVSSLDVSIQSQILNLLIDLQKEMQISYLFIAHNLTVVFYLSDRIAIMYTGKIVELANSKELYSNALHPYTKLLMSVAPKLGEKKDYTLINDMGEVPSLINYPKGCTFFDRCPIRKDICLNAFPKLEEVKKGHFCACYKVQKS